MFPRMRFAALCGAALTFLLGVRPSGAVSIFDAPSLPLYKPVFGGSVQAADMNADGIADIISANQAGVLLFRSLGAGSFAPGDSLWTQGNCWGTVVGDFDLDGRTDFVVSQRDSSRLLFFYGAPAGAIEPAVVFPTGATEQLEQARDLDGDLRLDLVTTCAADTLVRVYLATGPRAYGLVQQFPGVRDFYSSVLTDWNLDGRPDLALSSLYADSVAFHAGLPGGTFAPPSYGPYADVYYLLAGDIDGDVGEDLVLVRSGTDAQVLPSLGDGSFGAPLSIAGLRGWGGAIADFDADGIMDAVTTYANLLPPGRRNVAVARGLGGGAFAPVSTLMSYYPPSSVTLGDVDGDGSLDLLTGSGFGRPICIMIGNGDGSFGTPIAETARGASDVALGDVDGDLDPDAVVADPESAGVFLFTGVGNGRFHSRMRLATLSGARAARIGDIDRDGLPDVVAAGSGTLLVIPGAGGGTFGTPISLASAAGPPDLALGDLDGNQWPDVVVGDQSAANVRVFLGGPGGLVAGGSVSLPGSPRRLALGRFDADVNLDLAVTYGSSVGLYRGDGGGGFLAPGASALLQGTTIGVLFDDFDADGTAELAVGMLGAGLFGLARIEENGSGGLAAPTFWATSIEPGANADTGELIAADFDGDGDRDIFASAAQRWSSLLLNDGNGSFAAPIGFGNFWNSSGAATADLDGDGGADVVLSTTSAASGGVVIAGALAVLMNRVAAVADVPPPAATPLRGLQLALAPNPATQGSRITFVAPQAADASIEVYAVTGRQVASRALGLVAAGRRSEAIPSRAQLAPGLYWARVTVGETVGAIRFVVTR